MANSYSFRERQRRCFSVSAFRNEFGAANRNCFENVLNSVRNGQTSFDLNANC